MLPRGRASLELEHSLVSILRFTALRKLGLTPLCEIPTIARDMSESEVN
jgi:hypothetical protein